MYLLRGENKFWLRRLRHFLTVMAGAYIINISSYRNDWRPFQNHNERLFDIFQIPPNELSCISNDIGKENVNRIWIVDRKLSLLKREPFERNLTSLCYNLCCCKNTEHTLKSSSLPWLVCYPPVALEDLFVVLYRSRFEYCITASEIIQWLG